MLFLILTRQGRRKPLQNGWARLKKETNDSKSGWKNYLFNKEEAEKWVGIAHPAHTPLRSKGSCSKLRVQNHE